MDAQRSACMIAAAVLWTSGLALGLAGSTIGGMRLLFWGGFSALVACIVSNHLVVTHAIRAERIRVESLAEAVIDKARDRADVSRLR